MYAQFLASFFPNATALIELHIAYHNCSQPFFKNLAKAMPLMNLTTLLYLTSRLATSTGQPTFDHVVTPSNHVTWSMSRSKPDEYAIVFCFLVDQVELSRSIIRKIVIGGKSVRFSKIHNLMPATKLVRSKNLDCAPGRNSWIEVTRDKARAMSSCSGMKPRMTSRYSCKSCTNLLVKGPDSQTQFD